MYGKRSASSSATASSPGKKLRGELMDVSCPRVSRLAQAAADAGAQGLKTFINKAEGRNAARDLVRYAQRGSRWPRLYETNLPSRTVASERERGSTVAVLLPHEFVYVLLEYTEKDVLVEAQRQALRERPDLQALGLSPETLLLALWQDGVPFNRNREHSLELWSLSILVDKDMRVPVTGWPKDLECKNRTHEVLFEVLAWSFQCLDAGVMPSCRHDGTAFASGDSWRRKLGGQPLAMKARLADMRGDWSMYKSVLALPGWQDGDCICWKCNSTKEDLQSVRTSAAWRRENLTHEQFLARQRAAGKRISSFFHIPHATIDVVRVDFLHSRPRLHCRLPGQRAMGRHHEQNARRCPQPW